MVLLCPFTWARHVSPSTLDHRHQRAFDHYCVIEILDFSLCYSINEEGEERARLCMIPLRIAVLADGKCKPTFHKWRRGISLTRWLQVLIDNFRVVSRHAKELRVLLLVRLTATMHRVCTIQFVWHVNIEHKVLVSPDTSFMVLLGNDVREETAAVHVEHRRAGRIEQVCHNPTNNRP